MWNGSDWVAMAAIAAGTAGSVALYSGLSDRPHAEVRTIVVEEIRRPVPDGSPRLRLHRLDPPPEIHLLPRADELTIRHVPYVVIETARGTGSPSFDLEGTLPSFDVDGRRYRIHADGRAVEIEKRRDRRPDRKRKRRRRGNP